ncbi:MAG: NifU family protein [Bacteroidia bacterium]|nr:NifU family protein [Bacteroidia bacterium]
MSPERKKEILNKANLALEEIRPFLMQDGGNVEVVDVTDDLVLKVEFKGACCSCSMTDQTFKNGIEEVIRKAIPEIKSIDNITQINPKS